MSFLNSFWGILAEMSPYLLLGFLVAGILFVWVPQNLVARSMGRPGMGSVIKAALLGIPLPLCSCGVIPVAASLRRRGATRGATASFLLSTPQTGVDSILVTYSLLGGVFAVFRPLAALITGVVGGALIHAIDEPEAVDEDGIAQTNPERATGDRLRDKVTQMMRYGFETLPSDIGKELVLGLILAALITVLVPDDFFAAFLGNHALTMLAMLALGLPMYVCATGSVPIAAALIAKGVSPGAALVFLMTGPATNAAAITTMWRVLGRKSSFAYLAVVAITALASGFALDALFQHTPLSYHAMTHAMKQGFLGHVSAIVLIGVLAWALFLSKYRGGQSMSQNPSESSLYVKGMSCSRCADHVKEAVAAVQGVSDVHVNHQSGQLTFQGQDVDLEAVRKAIADAGYTPG